MLTWFQSIQLAHICAVLVRAAYQQLLQPLCPPRWCHSQQGSLGTRDWEGCWSCCGQGSARVRAMLPLLLSFHLEPSILQPFALADHRAGLGQLHPAVMGWGCPCQEKLAFLAPWKYEGGCCHCISSDPCSFSHQWFFSSKRAVGILLPPVKLPSTRCNRMAAPIDGGSTAHVQNCCAFKKKGVINNVVLDYCQQCQHVPAGRCSEMRVKVYLANGDSFSETVSNASANGKYLCDLSILEFQLKMLIWNINY